MRTRSDEGFEGVTTPSEEIVSTYRKAIESDDSTATLALVHYRGGRLEFEIGRRCAESNDPLDRATGCDVLAQLGWGDDCFHDESVDILLRHLGDADDRVVASAAHALGHRKSPRSIEAILLLVDHANSDVRYAVVHGITGQNDPAAIDGLITLTRDQHRDVRNWAAFGLGTISDADSKELRDALIQLLHDSDPEIRGEALIGLSKRHETRVLPALECELAGEFYGSWCVEAATLMQEPRLIPLLEALRDRVPLEEAVSCLADFESAINACREGDQAR